jgi:hypothetical protein
MRGSDKKTNVEINIINKNTEREIKRKVNKKPYHTVSASECKKKDKHGGSLTSSKLIWSKIIKLIEK